MTIKKYNKDFYKVYTTTKHVEDNLEKVPRCINRIIFESWEEMSLLSPNSMEEA